MSVEGCALQLLRASQDAPQQLMTHLQPLNGRLPQTEQQFNELSAQLRRYGHIAEGTQGNIGNALVGQFRQARTGAYLSDQAVSSCDNDQNVYMVQYSAATSPVSFSSRALARTNRFGIMRRPILRPISQEQVLDLLKLGSPVETMRWKPEPPLLMLPFTLR
jgi:hypothetical protein